MSRRASRVRESTPRLWRPSDLASYDGPLLLDTHVWIWYVDGDSTRLSPATIALLERAGRDTGLLVLDISYWEVAVKAAKGKLALSVDVALWLQRVESAPGIRHLPLDRQALLLSTRLPGAVHNDPADRMLIATAQLTGAPLVTADADIIAYAKAHRATPVVDIR